MPDEFSDDVPSELSSDDPPIRLADLPRGPLGNMVHFFPAPELAAAKTRRAVLGGRDEPHRHTNPATLASFAAGFARGSGQLDALGLMPDFEGGFEPSLLENLRQGNYLTAGAQALGAATGFGVPVKVAKKVRLADRVAGRVPLLDRSVHRTDAPQFELERPKPRHVSPELANLLSHSKLEEKMLEVIEAGRKLGATRWYNTEPLRQRFIARLGPAEGDARFHDYLRFVAATSAASDVGTNVRNGGWYFKIFRNGEDLPMPGDRNPNPYGHFAARNHQIFARKVADNEFDPLIYQKMTSFFENLRGNYKPVTVDRHALRLPAMLAEDANFLTPKYKKLFEKEKISMAQLVKIPGAWRTPTADEIPVIEQFYKRIAPKAGLLPAEAQVAAWVGGDHKTGVRSSGFLSWLDQFEDRVHRAAEKYKITPTEVLDRFIDGKLNLVSVDSASTMTG